MKYLLSAVASLLLCTSLFAHETDPRVAAEEMRIAADRFLASLEEDARARAQFAFTADERENWHFFPDNFVDGGRKGLPLKDMQADQRALAHALPAAALSHRGHLKAMTIMALEQILYENENGNNPYRDPARYYVTVFGEPSAKGTWGWRFEGHHLALNMTIVDGGKFSVTPSFFGTNPAIADLGDGEKREVLHLEEELALELINSLDEKQLEAATLEGGTVTEILTEQERTAAHEGLETKGVAFKDLDKEQKNQLKDLVAVYFERYRGDVLAGTRYESLPSDWSNVTFAWSGGKERGKQHYYRVQSDTFLIEFANAQNNANHAHAVLREFNGDFGRDLLGEHFREAHAAE